MNEYIKFPNLPQKKIKKVLVDYRLSNDSIKELNDAKIEVCFSKKIDCLYNAVCGHPDMQIHHLGGSCFVCAQEVYDYYSDMLIGADIIMGEKPLKEKYPDDIYYNAASVGNYIICKADSTEEKILRQYNDEYIININQGYAKCNIAVIGKKALITSDKGIYKKALEKDIDVLLIKSGFIELNGLSYGFIGGASGMIAPDILAVNGNIDTHPDCKNMKAFCRNYGIYIISLNRGKLCDVGSIVPLI